MLIKKYLGQTLADMGFITTQQLDEALHRQKQVMKEKASPERLQRDRLVTEARLAKEKDMPPLIGQILTKMGHVTNEQLEQALQEQEKTFQAYMSLENEKLGIAVEIGALVNSTLSLAEVLHLIMTHANRVTNSVASTLMLVDETTGELVFSVPTGPKEDKLIDIRIPLGEGIAGWVMEHERPALIPNVKEDTRFYPKIDEISGFETESMLCVPLKAKTKLIGVLQAINKVDRTFFTEKDELLLSMFGYQAAVAIENARLYGELKEQLAESKRTERALRESEEKLTRAKKMEALGLLAGGVAHDLNNVLSGIVSYPEMLLLDLPKDSKLRKPIETIQETGHRAAAIVQDLLTVARGVAITKEPLNLNTIVENFLLSPEFEKLKRYHPTVTIKTNLDTDLFNISGSDAHLSKVVMNLVSNATEAIEGGGNVIISTMNRYIDRPIRGYDDVNVGEYAVLSVSDGGSGINGRETYARIIKKHPNQKAVISSGFAETDDVKEAQKLGAGQYIKKPLTLEKMGIAVRDELKK